MRQNSKKAPHKAARYAALALRTLQHRGQKGWGIGSREKVGGVSFFHTHYKTGLISANFTPEILKGLPGDGVIGHTRYSTSGQKDQKDEGEYKDLQPFFAETAVGGIAVAHNGTLTNADDIRKEMILKGHVFHPSSDSGILPHLFAKYHKGGQIQRIITGLKKVKGSYSLVILTEKGELVGVRDPYGIRPLVLGKIPGGWILASETCAIDAIGGKTIREVEPGEMVIISKKGIRSLNPFPKKKEAFCVFEFVYFGRPNSVIKGLTVQKVRKSLGRMLAQSCPAEADLVIGVPDSGMPAAIGFSEQSGIPYDMGLCRDHYTGRSFLETSKATRAGIVLLKLSVVKPVVFGKRIVVVDDSIVRGTVSKKILEMLWKAGAKEIHLRITCPPIKYPCFYGIDTPSKEELFANKRTVEQMQRKLGVTSLGFLPLKSLLAVAGQGEGAVGKNCESCSGFCDACFTGKYPV